MTPGGEDGENYLTRYPKLMKWINQCGGCQSKGYKPELPDEIYPGGGAQNLREYFRVMAFDGRGLCLVCSRNQAI